MRLEKLIKVISCASVIPLCVAAQSVFLSEPLLPPLKLPEYLQSAETLFLPETNENSFLPPAGVEPAENTHHELMLLLTLLAGSESSVSVYTDNQGETCFRISNASGTRVITQRQLENNLSSSYVEWLVATLSGSRLPPGGGTVKRDKWLRPVLPHRKPFRAEAQKKQTASCHSQAG